MSADRVVEHFDEAKDCAASFLPCRKDLFSNAFTLGQLGEAPRHDVVVADSLPAHAGLQVLARQEALPFMTGELTAPIGIHNDDILGPSAPDCHVQGIKSQSGVNAAACGATNDLLGAQVDYRN